MNRATFDQVMVPNYVPQSIIPVRAQGSKVWDDNNIEYIDFAGGIAVTALGHCHPDLVAILKNQGEKLWHLSNIYTNKPALSFASLLIKKTFAEKVFFCNSGTEENDDAFKLARKYSYDHYGKDKHEIISFKKAFHGRSLFAVSVGGTPKYQEGFEPAPQGITHLPFNDIDALKAAISDKTCAVIVEPIQGEGGVIPADFKFLQAAYDLCQQYNALLVFDEVQTGAGRTGHLYAYMGTPVIPDILTTAKGLGSGFPVAAMLTRSEIATSLGFGTHGSTYGGNPLACAIAEKAFSLISDPKLLENVHKKYTIFVNELKRLNDEFHVFADIRGKGLLIGAELIESWHGKAKLFLQEALKAKLMILVAGGNVLRFAPSLIISDQEIYDGMQHLRRAIQEVLQKT